MRGLLRDWLVSLRTKREVARTASLCGVSAADMYAALMEISGEPRRFIPVRLGGVNNQGMFLHLCNETGKPLALSKVQLLNLAQREALFMRWQEEKQLNLSGRCLSLLTPEGSDYAILCSEYLMSPSDWDAQKIHQLQRRFTDAAQQLQELGTADELTQLVVADTPIKRVLRGLVAQSADARIHPWCADFLQQRLDVLAEHEPQLQQLFSAVADRWQGISAPVSLVHGDFKRQNILSGGDGQYRAIDLQYYLPGQSCWDLAFYYSKYDAGFSSAWHDYQKYTDTPSEQQLQFVFFYIVASIVNVKRKRRNWILTTKVIPAMQEMEHLLGDHNFEK